MLVISLSPQTLKLIRRLLPTNCLSVFDHFAGLMLKALKVKDTD